MTQTDAVLRLLRERGADGLTPLEALQSTGTFRLAARVLELRAAGLDIETQTHVTPSGKRVARYVLHETSQLELFGQS